MYLNFKKSAKDLEIQIDNLKPQKGICIFLDICGSTEAKQEDLKHWLVKIGSTLHQCSDIDIMFKESVIKYIGDEVMLFIPENRILKHQELFNRVINVVEVCMDIENEKHLYYPIKASIHYCVKSYKVSYHKKLPVDYYGVDIDLAARLASKAKKSQIVISEEFFNKVKDENPNFFKNYAYIFCVDSLKGIKDVVGYYVLSMMDTRERNKNILKEKFTRVKL